MNASAGIDMVSSLEARHKALHDEVKALERRPRQTPDEQQRLAELKKAKLKAKDELQRAIGMGS
jgi:uncharacterized protein YdcH (DUF465 family)